MIVMIEILKIVGIGAVILIAGFLGGIYYRKLVVDARVNSAEQNAKRILEDLKKEVWKKFKGESIEVFRLMKTLEENPKKGKLLGMISGIAIKELKYKSFRFYFLVEENRLNILDEESLKDLLIKFVRMSDKKEQQKTINEIRAVLLKIGEEGF